MFHWDVASFRQDLIFLIAVALCLAVGIGVGHPAAGMIAAGGAMTVGFGAKQSIDSTPLVPMMLCAVGMAVATFLGMVAGHRGVSITFMAVTFGFIYGMFSKRAAGYIWVAQQCLVSLLIASAFPATAQDALQRAALIFAGGVLQLIISSLCLRIFDQLGTHVAALARYAREEEQALREIYLSAVTSLRQRSLRDSSLPYATRVAVVLGLSTEIYRAMHFASGYWIPMTALLVLRPGIADTASRAIARTTGTLIGAALTTTLLAYTHPPEVVLAAFAVLFTWLSYSLVNVNYALFSLCLTSYVVFLLSLAGVSGHDVARRRFICTLLGGVIALTVRLFVIRLRKRQDLQGVEVQQRVTAPA